jgi:hypothetical protein
MEGSPIHRKHKYPRDHPARLNMIETGTETAVYFKIFNFDLKVL